MRPRSSLARRLPADPHNGQRGVTGTLRESLAARILYRDGLVLVVDKPAGIAVHPGPGGGPNLESGFDGLRFGLPHPPALAHRLDRDTSGCLVLGRHAKALRRLGALFAGKCAGRQREYQARFQLGGAAAGTVIAATLGTWLEHRRRRVVQGTPSEGEPS